MATQVQSWGQIVAILIVVALISGLVLGSIDYFIGLPQSMLTGGVGASVGVVGAILIGRRRAQK